MTTRGEALGWIVGSATALAMPDATARPALGYLAWEITLCPVPFAPRGR